MQFLPRHETILWYIKYAHYAILHPKQVINFNHWFSSFDYRRSLEDQHDMIESDANLEHLPKFDFGVGSTFNEREFDGKAQQMNVLRRWERVQEDPNYYQPLQRHPELADIAKELFDFEPPPILG